MMINTRHQKITQHALLSWLASLAIVVFSTTLIAPQVVEANPSPEQQVLQLVNEARADAGLAPLRNNSKLAAAARNHSRDMANRNYFSHTDKNGRSAGQRITAQGYRWNAWGENIAWGYDSAQAVMQAWMRSSGHRANILNSRFCDIGIGIATTSGPRRIYWTQNFGRQQGVSECANAQTPSPAPPPPAAPPADGGQTLTNKQRVKLRLNSDQVARYTVTIPAGTRVLRAILSGSGNGDIYVRRGTIRWPADKGRHNDPTFRSLQKANSYERVVINRPQAGVWHILVHGAKAMRGSLHVSW